MNKFSLRIRKLLLLTVLFGISMNVFSQKSVADNDNDGLSDVDEFNIYHTNPWDDDTDDDGLLDGNEVLIYFTDPLNADTDRDMLQDGTEVGISSPQGTDTYAWIFIPDGDSGLTTTSPLNSDSDNGGLVDGFEDYNRNGKEDAGETNPLNNSDDIVLTDTDNDGLPNVAEITMGTDSLDDDSDDDGILDGNEVLIFSTHPNQWDTDADDLPDGVEVGLSAPQGSNTYMPWFRADADHGATTTNPLMTDSDWGGVADGWEDLNHNGRFDPTEFDPNNYNDDPNDADHDGVKDYIEDMYGTQYLYIGFDADSDHDGLSDYFEILGNDGLRNTGDEPGTDPTNQDTDNDNFFDGEEINRYLTDPLNADSDNDLLIDQNEVAIFHTNPLDDDTDDDGLKDGNEIITYNTDPSKADTDNDLIQDGTELGLTVAEGTQTNLTIFIPDADGGITTTDPNNADTDNGGIIDGFEDYNLNGVVDAGEYDPNNISDDVTPVDTDNDSLPDMVEITIGTNPNSPDSDNDGLNDGEEVFVYHSDPMDSDSDNDGLFDGNEVLVRNTNPVKRDTDDDGLSDYQEINVTNTDPLVVDTDGDNLLDGDEVNIYHSDPLNMNTDNDNATDDYEVFTLFTDPTIADTDSDGILDGQESWHNTDPNNYDTDNDWMSDGDEINVYSCDPNNIDTDNDLLPDGDELIHGCDPLVPDGDSDNLTDGYEVYTTFTDPNDYDTDNDSLSDGFEWMYTDPNNPDTDNDFLTDGEEVLNTLTNPLDNDTDDDTYLDGLDCNPLDSTIHPGAIEIECDGIDQNCNPYDEDTIPPVLNCPNEISLYVNNLCEAVVPDVSFIINVTDLCSDTLFITQTPTSGQFINTATTVQITVSDTAGNSTNASLLINIIDTIPPSVVCPSDIVSTSAQVTYSLPQIFDNCQGAMLQLTQGLYSGSDFPPGNTGITYLAIDTAGNSDSCSFMLTYSPVGINNAELNGIIQTYPNPANEILFIKGLSQKPQNILIYDLTGQELVSPVFLYKEEAVEVNLKQYLPGVYLIKVVLAEKVYMEKILIGK